MTQFAPTTESYLPAPEFKYAPTQKEIDFAQLVAAGGDLVDSLVHSSLVSQREAVNMERSSLYSMATRVLGTKAVQERIDFYRMLHQKSMSVTVDRLQQELAANAFSDFALMYHEEDGPEVEVRDFAVEDPEATKMVPQWRAGQPITNPHHLPRHVRAAVKEWGFDKDGVLKFKLTDSLKAMQMLGDLNGHFDESNRSKAAQVTVTLGGPDNTPKEIDITPVADELSCLD